MALILCRFVITDPRVCMSSSFSIIPSPYMVDRKGVRRTFRRTFFHGIEIHLLSVSMPSFGQLVVSIMLPSGKHLDGCLYGSSFCLCSASCACITVSRFFVSSSFFGLPLSRLAIHSTLRTSLNYNMVFLVVRRLRFCCPYFYHVLPLRQLCLICLLHIPLSCYG